MFMERVFDTFHEGASVLDVGSGRKPTVPPDKRPFRCRYVGLDLSAAELARAPDGWYDELIVWDVVKRAPELIERFDLVVSWQVLEHVKPLEAALENIRSYLRPGGRFVATLSGRFSVISLLNRLTPGTWGIEIMERLLRRNPESVFPAYYDMCWHDALKRVLEPWSRAEIVPSYIGATYFSFSRVLSRAYLEYENWVCERRLSNLATNYLIDAVR